MTRNFELANVSVDIISMNAPTPLVEDSKLVRGLGLKEATALNMIDMVGIGPFITPALVIGIMNGPQAIAAWIVGALLAFVDGFVWAELGARWPEAGGSYVFLKNLYGPKWGRLFSFLFIWQTVFQAPLVVASGAIGFAHYSTFLFPFTPLQEKIVSGALVILLTFVLYRKITSIGKLSIVLWAGVIGTMLWVIFAGATHFKPALAFGYSASDWKFDSLFFAMLGMGSVKTVYSYLGYYNVCHLGGEIKRPAFVIPRSILISVAGIAGLYLAMQLSLLGTLDWKIAKDSNFVYSLFFEHLYGPTAAKIATGLILFIAAASLFSAMLGYSRIPYAAARDGAFFRAFARIHPTKHFPSVSLLILGAFGFVFSLLFRLSDVITAILAMRILVQFIAQTVGLVLLHRARRKDSTESGRTSFPYKMPLFPLPALLAIVAWILLFIATGWPFMLGAVGMIILGVIVFKFRERQQQFARGAGAES